MSNFKIMSIYLRDELERRASDCDMTSTLAVFQQSNPCDKVSRPCVRINRWSTQRIQHGVWGASTNQSFNFYSKKKKRKKNWSFIQSPHETTVPGQTPQCQEPWAEPDSGGRPSALTGWGEKKLPAGRERVRPGRGTVAYNEAYSIV